MTVDGQKNSDFTHSGTRTMSGIAKTSHPTQVAIDSAIKRAISTGSVNRAVEPEVVEVTPVVESTFARNLNTFFGRAGSFERGFILTASLLLGLLSLVRIFFGSQPWIGVMVPMGILSMTLAYSLTWAGDGLVNRSSRLMNTRLKTILLGIVCAPLLSWFSRKKLSHAQIAILSTSWVAMMIGTISAGLG